MVFFLQMLICSWNIKRYFQVRVLKMIDFFQIRNFFLQIIIEKRQIDNLGTFNDISASRNIPI